MSAEIVIYLTPMCPYCQAARRLLDAKKLSYSAIDVTYAPEKRAEMRARSGGTTVPQIFIGGQPIGGSDELHALEREGRLDAVLAAAS